MKMKRFLGVAALAILVAFFSRNVMAQNLKFGHINSEELIQAMPEFDSANKKFENFRKDIQNAFELMTVELNNKSDQYQKESKNYTEIVRQNKEQELVDYNRRIQEFQQTAQTQLQEKQAELFQPVYTKADKAIKCGGKHIGFV